MIDEATTPSLREKSVKNLWEIFLPKFVEQRTDKNKGKRPGLFGFYGISTIVGYLMPNPVNTYISNI